MLGNSTPSVVAYFCALIELRGGRISALDDALRLLSELVDASLVYIELRDELVFRRGFVRAGRRSRVVSDRRVMPRVALACLDQTLAAKATPIVSAHDARIIGTPVGAVGALVLVRAGHASPVEHALVSACTGVVGALAGTLTRRPLGLREETHLMALARVRDSLAEHKGNISATARDLGVTRKVIHRYLRDVGDSE